MHIYILMYPTAVKIFPFEILDGGNLQNTPLQKQVMYNALILSGQYCTVASVMQKPHRCPLKMPFKRKFSLIAANPQHSPPQK